VDAATRGLGPARKTADAVMDFLSAKVNDLNVCTHLLQPFDQGISQITEKELNTSDN
jgi:hypothetical protein